MQDSTPVTASAVHVPLDPPVHVQNPPFVPVPLPPPVRAPSQQRHGKKGSYQKSSSTRVDLSAPVPFGPSAQAFGNPGSGPRRGRPLRRGSRPPRGISVVSVADNASVLSKSSVASGFRNTDIYQMVKKNPNMNFANEPLDIIFSRGFNTFSRSVYKVLESTGQLSDIKVDVVELVEEMRRNIHGTTADLVTDGLEDRVKWFRFAVRYSDEYLISYKVIIADVEEVCAFCLGPRTRALGQKHKSCFNCTNKPPNATPENGKRNNLTPRFCMNSGILFGTGASAAACWCPYHSEVRQRYGLCRDLEFHSEHFHTEAPRYRTNHRTPYAASLEIAMFEKFIKISPKLVFDYDPALEVPSKEAIDPDPNDITNQGVLEGQSISSNCTLIRVAISARSTGVKHLSYPGDSLDVNMRSLYQVPCSEIHMKIVSITRSGKKREPIDPKEGTTMTAADFPPLPSSTPAPARK